MQSECDGDNTYAQPIIGKWVVERCFLCSKYAVPWTSVTYGFNSSTTATSPHASPTFLQRSWTELQIGDKHNYANNWQF